MTTEDDFQKALDVRPDDWQTRLVFADWLQERNDPRAEGYRALGAWRRVPHWYSHSRDWGFDSETASTPPDGDELPDDWFLFMEEPEPRGNVWHRKARVCKCRRLIEDAAALAFSKLPAARRIELLAPPAPRKQPRKVRKPAAKKPKAKRRKR